MQADADAPRLREIPYNYTSFSDREIVVRLLGDTAWDRLLTWAQVDSATAQTQAQLVELWQVKQPSVSQTLQQLIEAGAVEALPRRGREAIQYLMTGTARLAL